MIIKEKALHHWLHNFYGYGSWDARVWFISHEEGGGDTPAEVAEKFDHFLKTYPPSASTLCDIREMYRQVAFRTEGPRADVFSNLHDYRFGTKSQLNGVWKNLISFVHGYHGKTLPNLLNYQKKFFATKAEALIQLFPLPSPHNHAWYYSWLDLPKTEFLSGRKSYEEHMYAARMRTILERMAKHKPAVVVMYGMSNIQTLKQSVTAFFPSAKFKMVKADPQRTPQHHRADFNGTSVVITTQIPTLRHNRPGSGFDWYQFGEIVRGMR